MNKAAKAVALGTAVITLFAAIVIVISAVHYAPASSDAAYYLQMAKEIVSGKRLYVDLRSSYAPLGMITYAGLQSVGVATSVSTVLVFQYGLLLISALILVAAMRILSVRWFVTGPVVCAYLYSCSWLLRDVKLEAIVLPVAAFYAYLLVQAQRFRSKRYFIAMGVVIGVAFMIKQYALVYMLPALLLAVIREGKLVAWGVRSILLTIVALCVTIVVVMLALGAMHGQPMLYVSNIGLAGSQLAGALPCDVSYGSLRIQEAAAGIVRYGIYYWPAIIILMPVLVYVLLAKRSEIHNIDMLACFCAGSVMSSIVLLFQVFPHYMLYSLPFIAVATSLVLMDISAGDRHLSVIIILLVMIAPAAMGIRGMADMNAGRAALIDRQGSMAGAVRSVIPEMAPVYFTTKRYLWYLGNYKCPIPETVGYSFVDMGCTISHVRHYSSGDWVVSSARQELEGFIVKVVIDERYRDTLYAQVKQ